VTYADNVVMMGISLQAAEGVFTSLVNQTDKMGLEINGKKTKFFIAS
jgi:hypothetical protein